MTRLSRAAQVIRDLKELNVIYSGDKITYHYNSMFILLEGKTYSAAERERKTIIRKSFEEEFNGFDEIQVRCSTDDRIIITCIF